MRELRDGAGDGVRVVETAQEGVTGVRLGVADALLIELVVTERGERLQESCPRRTMEDEPDVTNSLQ